MNETKRCPTCRETKPHSEFHRRAKSKDGRYPYCKPCVKVRNSAWVAANPEKQNAASMRWYWKNKPRAASNGTNWHYRKHYGITYAQFVDLYESVKGICPICSTPMVLSGPRKNRRLNAVLDHCHETGQNRGVICSGCNIGLGMLKDSPKVLASAVAYLERYGKPELVAA